MIASTTTYWHSTTAATTDSYTTLDNRTWNEVHEIAANVTVTAEEQQPAAEPERDTGRRVPICERLDRRLATVTGLRRNINRPPQQASTYG